MKVRSVSAVVPTYNDAGRIGDALASISGQSRPPQEIIVADDCSTDDTEEVVRHFAARHPSPPVHYLRLQTRGGVVGARNQGIGRAKGEWIANCDSDDIWVRDKLERQIAFISSWQGEPLSLLGTFGYNVNERDEIVSPADMGPTTEAEFAALARAGRIFYVIHSSVMFPKALYEAAGGYTTEYGAADDYAFFATMSDHGVVLVLNERLVHYRKRSGSIQLARFADQREGLARLAENRRRAARGQPALSAEAFREQLDAAPLLKRIRRRRSALGMYHYRVGAAYVINGRKPRGLLHLLVATALDRRRTLAGIRGAQAQGRSSGG